MSWEEYTTPTSIAAAYGLKTCLDFGRGDGLVLTTGAGLMLALMDQIPNARWCVDIGPDRGTQKVIDWATFTGRLVRFTVAHLWMSLTGPAWMKEVLSCFPQDRLAVWSWPQIQAGYTADSMEELAQWAKQWSLPTSGASRP